jgi:hypothetical protein
MVIRGQESTDECSSSAASRARHSSSPAARSKRLNCQGLPNASLGWLLAIDQSGSGTRISCAGTSQIKPKACGIAYGRSPARSTGPRRLTTPGGRALSIRGLRDKPQAECIFGGLHSPESTRLRQGKARDQIHTNCRSGEMRRRFSWRYKRNSRVPPRALSQETSYPHAKATDREAADT